MLPEVLTNFFLLLDHDGARARLFGHRGKTEPAHAHEPRAVRTAQISEPAVAVTQQMLRREQDSLMLAASKTSIIGIMTERLWKV